ncbi:MAG: hypothetical protein MUF64_32090 [Polyangiaceae bacterium]|nr:hypothetical protein [Polyangiaceae bacterium]
MKGLPGAWCLSLLAAVAAAGCSETGATRDPASTPPMTSTANTQGAMAKPPTTGTNPGATGSASSGAQPTAPKTPEPPIPPPT